MKKTIQSDGTMYHNEGYNGGEIWAYEDGKSDGWKKGFYKGIGVGSSIMFMLYSLLLYHYLK